MQTNSQESKLVSVPFGGLSDYNSGMIEILKELGYRSMLLSRNRVNWAGEQEIIVPGFEFLKIERIMPQTSLETYKSQLRKASLKSLVLKTIQKLQ